MQYQMFSSHKQWLPLIPDDFAMIDAQVAHDHRANVFSQFAAHAVKSCELPAGISVLDGNQQLINRLGLGTAILTEATELQKKTDTVYQNVLSHLMRASRESIAAQELRMEDEASGLRPLSTADYKTCSEFSTALSAQMHRSSSATNGFICWLDNSKDLNELMTAEPNRFDPSKALERCEQNIE
jgi:hypothetical protein